MGFENYKNAETLGTGERLALYDAILENDELYRGVDAVCNNMGFDTQVLRNMLEDAADDVPQHLQRVGQILILLNETKLQPEDVKEKTTELISLVKTI